MVANGMGNRFGQHWGNLFAQHAVQKNYTAGQTLDFQGQKSEYFSLVISGRIEAIVFSENGDEIWIDEYKAGDFIGHLSFLENTPSQFELVAASQASVYRLPRGKIRELMDDNIDLRDNILADLVQRLDVLTRGLTEAYALSAKGRICAELLRLSREIGIDPNKRIIRPNPVYVDFARRVNSTRETVSRTVSDLQKMGILSRQPGALIVEHPDKLATAFK